MTIATLAAPAECPVNKAASLSAFWRKASNGERIGASLPVSDLFAQYIAAMEADLDTVLGGDN